MNTIEKIDYMMASLQIAKDEISYSIEYKKIKKEERKRNINPWDYNSKLYKKRTPNLTIIRENLKMIGRMGFVTSKEI